jgi:pimeloyl-ACP methyl ester carboxylesterase
VKTLRGLIVRQHGCGPGDDREARAVAGDLQWQVLARKHECALLVPTYEQSLATESCRLWFDPRNGSDKEFIRALAKLAKRSGHPELTTVPWALWGHSGGAHWAGSMLYLHPGRVAAVWLRSGFPIQQAEPIPAAALTVPVMCNLGAQEGVVTTNHFFTWGGVREFFQEFRGQGGLISVAVDPNSEHDCGNSRYLAIPWFDLCLTARLPDTAGSAALKPMPTDSAWLAPLLGKSAQPVSKFRGDPKSAVWLPNAQIAKAWCEFVKDGNVSDPTPPPPPKNVRISSTGEITWNAEADLESGIAEFVIERDGKQLARLPEHHTGYFVGRPTFQQIGYGDEPKWPFLKMRYSVAETKQRGKHIYAVRTVNTTGLKSASTPAIAVTAAAEPGEEFPSEFVSTLWPKGPPINQQRATIQLDARLLDACVGHYEVAPCAVLPNGQGIVISRDGTQLRARFSVGTVSSDALPVYTASETNFYFKIERFGELFVIKNDKEDVTAVIRRFGVGGGIQDCLAKKIKD